MKTFELYNSIVFFIEAIFVSKIMSNCQNFWNSIINLYLKQTLVSVLNGVWQLYFLLSTELITWRISLKFPSWIWYCPKACANPWPMRFTFNNNHYENSIKCIMEILSPVTHLESLYGPHHKNGSSTARPSRNPDKESDSVIGRLVISKLHRLLFYKIDFLVWFWEENTFIKVHL